MSKSSENSNSKKVVIVGGGIAGLSAAYDLSRAGVETILFEKKPRLGGVIETQSWEDCVFDTGPDSFISQKPEALALIKELGLGDEVIGSNDHQRTTYILKKGRLVALPEGVMMIVPSKVMPMVKSPLLSWATKIRMGFELLRRPNGASPDRSVAEFVVDHFGQETLDYLAEPLLSGVYGGDPAKLSIASVLPRFLDMEKKYGSLGRAVMSAPKPPSSGGSLFRSMKSGMTTVVNALSKFAHVRHEQVDAVEPFAAGRYRVRAGGEWMEASDVIIAAPAWSAAALVGKMDAALAAKLGEIDYSSSLTLSLVYRNSEFDGKRAGFGFLVPAKERERVAAATFVGTKFPHRTPDDKIVLRLFLGGAGDEAILSESDESVVRVAREELRRILGVTAAPVHQIISRWPRSMAQYTVGHAGRISEIKERLAKLPGLYLAGNAYEGIGIPDCVRMGRAAAKAIVAS
ncbi:MAG: protoporphyrinogen oxidase [Acidobacteriia bacterium]|nr:protoporphyrinogen oxidase [Terriglobia bacterium]